MRINIKSFFSSSQHSILPETMQIMMEEPYILTVEDNDDS